MPAAARAGAIAPCDVTVPAQNTGLGPEKTSFFQALGITTKISRGTIEILVSELQLFGLLLYWEALIVAAEGAVKAKALIRAKILCEQCDYCTLGSGGGLAGLASVCSVGGIEVLHQISWGRLCQRNVQVSYL